MRESRWPPSFISVERGAFPQSEDGGSAFCVSLKQLIMRALIINCSMKKMKRNQILLFVATLACGYVAMLTSCGTRVEHVAVPTHGHVVKLDCVKPDYLKKGDKVALVSPSYFTPMENVEKTADVLRGWGLEPVVGPNVGKMVCGRYAGTISERVSDNALQAR